MLLRLYIAGNAPNSLIARRNLDAALGSIDPDSYRLEVIDCMTDPMRTLGDGIVVTPTLRRTAPEPEATVIGTLSDADSLRHIIGIGEP
jgi:circadian clock protein KaiB